jgi:hypothetical protein
MFYSWIQSYLYKVIDAIPYMFNTIPFALITVIDGYHIPNRGVGFYRKDFKKNIYEFQHDGLLVGGAVVVELHKERKLFTTFDEIWFFEEKPKLYPTNLRLTGPFCFRQADPAPYIQWMNDSKCILGIGDGSMLGLNYITTKKEIAQQLESLDLDPDSK